jgi:hypothetical protein
MIHNKRITSKGSVLIVQRSCQAVVHPLHHPCPPCQTCSATAGSSHSQHSTPSRTPCPPPRALVYRLHASKSESGPRWRNLRSLYPSSSSHSYGSACWNGVRNEGQSGARAAILVVVGHLAAVAVAAPRRLAALKHRRRHIGHVLVRPGPVAVHHLFLLALRRIRLRSRPSTTPWSSKPSLYRSQNFPVTLP